MGLTSARRKIMEIKSVKIILAAVVEIVLFDVLVSAKRIIGANSKPQAVVIRDQSCRYQTDQKGTAQPRVGYGKRYLSMANGKKQRAVSLSHQTPIQNKVSVSDWAPVSKSVSNRPLGQP